MKRLKKHHGLKDHISVFYWQQHNSKLTLSENKINICIYNQELLKTTRKTEFNMQNLLELVLSLLTELKKI